MSIESSFQKKNRKLLKKLGGERFAHINVKVRS